MYKNIWYNWVDSLMGMKYKLKKKCFSVNLKWLNDGISLVCSPRMWRWSQYIHLTCFFLTVFSTYVEVIRLGNHTRTVTCSVLHVCGGDPFWVLWWVFTQKCSPRMWRWSYITWFMHRCFYVFSTYVEVIFLGCILNRKNYRTVKIIS